MGTVFSDDWEGGYFSNDYQWVTDADARSLALALERAIKAVNVNMSLTDQQKAERNEEVARQRFEHEQSR